MLYFVSNLARAGQRGGNRAGHIDFTIPTIVGITVSYAYALQVPNHTYRLRYFNNDTTSGHELIGTLVPNSNYLVDDVRCYESIVAIKYDALL